MSKTGFIFSRAGLEHKTPMGHPECPARITAILRAFEKAGLNPPRVEPVAATREDLLRIHTTDHIDIIEETCASGGRYPDVDTYMGPGSWEAALLAAGAAIQACKVVINRDFDNVFSAMRPPGHHAEPDRAMGFCLFNNVAIAARWLRERAGVKRVAILDWDVHHGNGTQHSFYDDSSVYYVSLHQCPHYPGTGHPGERGEGDTNLNITMRHDASREHWLEAFETKAIPEIENFDPEFLLISSGFDAHKKDPLASLSLETEDYATMTRMVKHIADGRIVSLLEGGYNLQALGESSVAHFKALQED